MTFPLHRQLPDLIVIVADAMGFAEREIEDVVARLPKKNDYEWCSAADALDVLVPTDANVERLLGACAQIEAWARRPESEAKAF